MPLGRSDSAPETPNDKEFDLAIVIDDEMVNRACVAYDGEKWWTFNASLWPQMTATLKAALGPDAVVVVSDAPPQLRPGQ